MLELIFCDRVLNLYGFLIYPLNLCKVTKYMYKPFSLSNKYQCVENFAQTVLKISQVSDIHDKNCVCEKGGNSLCDRTYEGDKKIGNLKRKRITYANS